jgi:glycosyltransferase involved in cell wall biosynthesis
MVFSEDPFEVMEGVAVRRYRSFYLGQSERLLAGVGKAGLPPRLFLDLIKERRADLVHLHCHNRLSSIATILTKGLRVPTVVSVHSTFSVLEPRWRYAFPNEGSLRAADRVIVVDKHLIAPIASMLGSSDRVSWIPNGVDISQYSSGEGGAFRKRHKIGSDPIILCVGRVCDVKNQLALLRSFPLIRKALPMCKLVFIGPPSEPDYARKLEQDAVRLRISDNVMLIPGFAPGGSDLLDAYAAADVVAVPSKYEAHPVVVLEAWAAGKAVVATDVGGLGSLVSEAGGGIVVPAKAPETGLAQAILRLLGDKVERDHLAVIGRKAAEGFSVEKVTAQTAALYREVMMSRGRKAG